MDFLTKAQQRESAAVHIATHQDVDSHEVINLGGRAAAFKEKNSLNILRNMIDKVFTVTPSATQLAQAGVLEFTIPEGSLGTVQDAALCLSIANNHSTSTITLAPAPFWINRVEFYAQSGNRLVQSITGLQLFLNLLQFTQEQLTVHARTLNMTAAFGAADAIAEDGGTYDAIIPLLGAFYEQTRPYMASWQGYHTVRVYLNNQIVEDASDSGTIADISLTAASIRYCVEDMSKAETSIRQAAGKVMPRVYRFMNWKTVTEANKALAASTEYTVNLGSFSGLIPFIFFVIRATPVIGDTLRTFSDKILKFAIYDSANNQLMGGSDIDFRYARFNISTHYFPSQGFAVLPIGFWAHATDLRRAILSGQNTGFQTFDTNNTLKFTTTDITPGNFDVTVLAPVYSLIRVDTEGKVEIIDS